MHMLIKNLLRFSYPVFLFFVPPYLVLQIDWRERGRPFAEVMASMPSGWVRSFADCMDHIQGVLLYAALFCLLLLWLRRPSWLVGIALLVLSLFAGPLGRGLLLGIGLIIGNWRHFL